MNLEEFVAHFAADLMKRLLMYLPRIRRLKI